MTDEALGQICFEQKLNAQISLSLPFTDEAGRPVQLAQYFGRKPVVLVLGYYQCPMLCTLVLNGMVESASDMKWSIGREYEVVDVSINPNETPALAAAKKRTYVKRYGRSGTAQGWHFLTGQEPAIRQLANEVGFRYAYDAASKQYAHPSGLIVLTPEGKTSHYLFGVTFASKDLYTALSDASIHQVGSPIQQFILLCFHYNPLTGKYSGSILAALRLLSIATLLGLVGLVVKLAGRVGAPHLPPDAPTPPAPAQPGSRFTRLPPALMAFPILPVEASKVAEQTDNLYWGLLCASAAVCLIVFVPMIYFIFKYRAGKPADRKPRYLPETRIEITWTVIPMLIFMCFYAWGAKQYFEIERPPANAMDIDVVGKQWMWKIQHPEGNREINELHVPVGRMVKLTMTSQDVIHSFFLPEFRIKQDVVPGRYTTEWFKADKIGTFHLFCSEYCGTSHSHMEGHIIVMSPADYQAWLTRGQPGSTLVQSGERLFRELGCSGCHEGNSVVHAPPLQGVFGKPVPLNDGEVVTADEGYLRDSIVFPAKQIVGGYTNDMPSFRGKVTEEELMELIAYLKKLGTEAPLTTP